MKVTTEKNVAISPAAYRRLKAIKAKSVPKRTMRELANEIILAQAVTFAVGKAKP